MSETEQGDVLIADSDPSIRGLLAAIVHRIGRRPVTAADGPAAFELISARRFDAVILDLRLPGMSGEALLREVAQQQAMLLPRTVVLSTGSTVRHGDLEHVAAILRKPFPIDELMDVLRRCCDGG
jgi:DNA-binding NtrC family response regulator